MANNLSLPHYTTFLTRLRQNRNTTPAPHKPVLLLALLDSLEDNPAPANHFPIDARLAALFERNWQLHVTTAHTRQFYQPLFYLQKDQLGWTLYNAEDQVFTGKNPIRRKAWLAEGYYGRFDPTFFGLLAQPSYRDYFRRVLIDWYFHTFPLSQPKTPNLLEEPPATYGVPLLEEVKRYRRSKHFAPAVLGLYDHTCAMSGLRVSPSNGLVQACHITPYADAQNDSYRNGIALSATLHRAFDTGLLSIDDDYRILLGDFSETKSPHSLRRLAGRRISLPVDRRFLPDRAALAEHRARNGFA